MRAALLGRRPETPDHFTYVHPLHYTMVPMESESPGVSKMTNPRQAGSTTLLLPIAIWIGVICVVPLLGWTEGIVVAAVAISVPVMQIWRRKSGSVSRWIALLAMWWCLILPFILLGDRAAKHLVPAYHMPALIMIARALALAYMLFACAVGYLLVVREGRGDNNESIYPDVAPEIRVAMNMVSQRAQTAQTMSYVSLGAIFALACVAALLFLGNRQTQYEQWLKGINRRLETANETVLQSLGRTETSRARKWFGLSIIDTDNGITQNADLQHAVASLKAIEIDIHKLTETSHNLNEPDWDGIAVRLSMTLFIVLLIHAMFSVYRHSRAEEAHWGCKHDAILLASRGEGKLAEKALEQYDGRPMPYRGDGLPSRRVIEALERTAHPQAETPSKQ